MRFTPNENSYIGFATVLTGTKAAPKVADVTGAVVLTSTVTGLTASSTGNAVPTPSFDSKWNGSIPGNVDGSFSMDGYRYTALSEDLLWTTLPRGTNGFIILARSGGAPSTAGRRCEVWDVSVLSRSVPAMTSGAAVTCTVTCSTPTEPEEDAVVVT